MKLLVHLFSGLMLISSAHAANIVFNPSFEIPALDPLDLAGWTRGSFVSNGGIDGLLPEDGTRFAVTACSNPGQCLEFNPLAQHLATTNGTYTLGFWYDLGSSLADDDGGMTSELIVKWGDQQVADIFAQDKPEAGSQFAMISGLQGNAASGVTLQFFGVNDTDSFLGIDNVSAIQTGDPAPAATPEPASGLLLAGGVLTLTEIAMRRRRTD